MNNTFLRPFIIAMVLAGSKCIVAIENQILAPGERLEQNHTIFSSNLMCQFLLQSNGDLVVKKNGIITWISGSNNAHDNYDGSFFVKLQKSGPLVIKRNETNEGIFSTNTRNTTLSDRGGGLFFNEDHSCSISIYPSYNEPERWSNIRRDFYNGNRLEKGEIIQYPSIMPTYALLLRIDGNLVMFKGADLSDYRPENIRWSAGVTSSSDILFLKFTCDGQLILKEKVNDISVPYWSMNIAALTPQGMGHAVVNESPNEGGQYLILQQPMSSDTTSLSPFAYGHDPTEVDCQPSAYIP